jgi:crossover junction endodeoxyribonuclease RuvC
MERVVGIDPGLSGGFCIMTLSTKSLLHEDIVFEFFPTIASEPDFQKLTYIFSCLLDCHAVLEKVAARPGQGVCSMFKFGRVYGALQALLAAHQIPSFEVTPQKWQAEMLEGIPVIQKTSGKKDTKKMALLAAQKLFPSLTIPKKHDGLVDALLIAEWGRRKLIRDLLQNVVPITSAQSQVT